MGGGSPVAKTILVVADNRVAHDSYRLALESAGFLVVEAAAGSALRTAQRALPSLVILEVIVADAQWVKLVGDLKNLPELQRVPIVAVSGSGAAADAARIASVGLAGYLDKPAPELLIEIVKALLRAGRSDRDDPYTLMRNAKTAMHAAKRSGRGWQFFDAGMQDSVLGRLEIERDLRGALSRHELFIEYQSIVDVAASSIVGVEALVRWRHPHRGLLPPAAFITVAEKTALIVPIGEWVLTTACAQAMLWPPTPRVRPYVAVNVCAREIAEKDFVRRVTSAIENTAIEPARVQLEITERVIMNDPPGAAKLIAELKNKGLRIAVDDFGIGLSSLSYLKHFPVDVLKIDRSFVRDLGIDERNAAIAKTIITLASGLELEVTAEGVETAEQVEILGALGCRRMQGYYFSKPASPAELINMLHER